MQYMRSVKAPFDLPEVLKFDEPEKDELFFYMSLDYDEDSSGIDGIAEIKERVVTKENFKAMYPILYPGLFVDEKMMTREWYLRDFN